MKKATVLLIEDETDVVDLVNYHLRRVGFNVLYTTTGAEGIGMAVRESPDLVLLDLMLPGMDGFEVCRELRKNPHTLNLPIIMLTARSDVADRIRGFETGTDDYLLKPFSPKELVLRVQAVMRRSMEKPPGDAVLRVNEFCIDRSSFTATIDNQKINLTQTEFKLLSLLVERQGRIQSRETLLFEVWGYQNTMDTRTVDTHVKRLREKLGVRANHIETVRGTGYRFVVDALG